jgi:hypothetical protein
MFRFWQKHKQFEAMTFFLNYWLHIVLYVSSWLTVLDMISNRGET